jgi:hypothetical protein
VDVSGAYLLGLDLSYQVAPKVGLGLGTELISGVRGGEVGKTRAFFPLYGTNHKFNGLMDYFYLGNHANSVGLVDIHASVKLTLGEGSDLQIEVLNFNTEQKLTNTGSSLGTEIDLVFSKSFKGYAINFGYSQLFPTDAMYTLKGASENAAANSQYWAWAMLILKPEFLNTAMKP